VISFIKRSFLNRRLIALALLLYIVPAANAQITKRIPDQDQTATAVAETGGAVWVGTSTGAYRIEGDTATRIPDFRLDIRGISVIDGVVWLATTQGAYRVEGNRAVRIPARGLVVTSVVKVGSHILLASPTGAYLVDGDDARRTPDRDLDVANIIDIDGAPWLATDCGAFRLTPTADGKSYTATHVVNEDYDLNQIIEIDGHPWLATDHGAFRIDPAGSKHIVLITPANPTFKFTGKAAEVFRIIPAGGRIWFISTSGCFRVQGDVADRIPDAKTAVANIVEGPASPGQPAPVWIATRTGAYRISGETVRRIPDLPLSVDGVTVINGKVWLATNQGAYRVDGDTAKRIPDDSLSVSSILDVNGRALLATSTGAIVVDRDGGYYQVLGGDVAVLASYIAGGNVWLSTSAGPFEVDTDSMLQLRLVPLDTGWKSWLRGFLPRGYGLAGEYGVRVVAVNDRTGVVRSISDARVAVEMGMGAIRSDFVDPSKVRLTLKPGERVVSGLIQVGRTPSISRVVYERVVPAWIIPVALAAIVWLLVSAVVFATSPFAEGSWRLLMRPGFRTFGSLGFVSLLLLMPVCRRYVLIRYRNGVEEALGPERLEQGAMSLNEAGRRLVSDHVAHVSAISMADPFITACYIARRGIAHDAELGAASRATPAPLLVSGNEVRDMGTLLRQLLRDYGQITDPKFAHELIERGGFLIVAEGDAPSTLDGDAVKQIVQEFVDRYRARNFICLVRRGD
jgi:hypothetical protein